MNGDVEILDNEEVQMCVEDCQKVQAWIYVLRHLTGGGLARSTEAAVLQGRNTCVSARNVILTKGQIGIAIFFHKGRSKAGCRGRPILRFLDAIT